MIGHAIEPVLAPLGFNWQMTVALIPGLAAREVAVARSAPSTPSAAATARAGALGQTLAAPLVAGHGPGASWPGTSSPRSAPRPWRVISRETNSWRWLAVMFVYMMALAYVAALITYQIARAAGAG